MNARIFVAVIREVVYGRVATPEHSRIEISFAGMLLTMAKTYAVLIRQKRYFLSILPYLHHFAPCSRFMQPTDQLKCS
jgi:hypothetical protein